jgi:hydroxymethylbilane synthase
VTARFRVGTRRSALARRQTDLVVRRLAKLAPGSRFETAAMETSGDRDRRPGSSPDFTDALDRAVLLGEVDLAVHSAKDLPVTLAPGLSLRACPPRADPRDCLVGPFRPRGRPLPRGARVGSSSPRRRAQLLRWRPDLRVVEVRGNVDTRIELVRTGSVEAVVLALAGLARLGRSGEAARLLPISGFLPAPAQGALAVVGRADDRRLDRVLEHLDHAPTRAAVTAERALAGALGADCRLPLGALATCRGSRLSLTAEALSLDGRKSLRARGSGAVRAAEEVGARLGRSMRERGAAELLAGSDS